jgi:hypothetical protein
MHVSVNCTACMHGMMHAAAGFLFHNLHPDSVRYITIIYILLFTVYPWVFSEPPLHNFSTSMHEDHVLLTFGLKGQYHKNTE